MGVNICIFWWKYLFILRINICIFWCKYLCTHIGYWKMDMFWCIAEDRYCYGNEDQRGVEPSGKFMFQQIFAKYRGIFVSCNIWHYQISRSKKDFWGWDVSCNLWHNHPFDLVWFYAHTICIFYQNCIRIYHFRDTYMYTLYAVCIHIYQIHSSFFSLLI